MLIKNRRINSISAGLIIMVIAAGCSNPKKETVPEIDTHKMVPTGTLSISGKSYALIISKTWGKGILHFKGKKYRIKAKSLGAGYAVGAKKFTIKATVYNLYRLADIKGNYYGTKAGATFGKGRYVANMGNSNGVTLGLLIKSKGLAIDAGAGLATLTIKIISMQPVK